MDSRSPWITPPWIPLAILGAFLVLHLALPTVRGNWMIEAAGLGTVLLLVLTYRPVVSLIREGGWVVVLLLLVVLIVIPAGHFWNAPRATYPLVSWQMYTDVQPRRPFYRYEVQLKSGEVSHLPLAAVVRYPSPRAILSAMHSHPSRGEAAEFLALIAASMNELGITAHPISHVRIRMCTFDPRAWPDARTVPCRDVSGWVPLPKYR